MNVYLEITLLPSGEIGHHFLWEKVYQQLHLGLASVQSQEGISAIGISLPEYNAEKYQLGSKLRLFAADADILEKFNALQWFNRLTDYVHVSSMREVPAKVAYAIYKRQQPQSNTERLARRKAKRANITIEQALEQLNGRKEEHVKTPFINMNSQTTGQRFRLFIDKVSVGEPISKGFTSYGLSSCSTVPEF